MRPSSGGSRRISKWFLPASALAGDFDGDAGKRHGGGRRRSGGRGRPGLRRRAKRLAAARSARPAARRRRLSSARRPGHRPRPAAKFPRRRGGRWPRPASCAWAAADLSASPARGLRLGLVRLARTLAWRKISHSRRRFGRNRPAAFAGSAALALGIPAATIDGWAAAAACASAAGAACATCADAGGAACGVATVVCEMTVAGGDAAAIATAGEAGGAAPFVASTVTAADAGSAAGLPSLAGLASSPAFAASMRLASAFTLPSPGISALATAVSVSTAASAELAASVLLAALTLPFGCAGSVSLVLAGGYRPRPGCVAVLSVGGRRSGGGLRAIVEQAVEWRDCRRGRNSAPAARGSAARAYRHGRSLRTQLAALTVSGYPAFDLQSSGQRRVHEKVIL